MDKKILIIDDDELVGKSVNKLLQSKGYEVHLTQSAKKALELVAENEFDLIISDIRMPEMDGIEVIRRIKEYQNQNDGAKSEFMAITGYASDDAPTEGAKLGIANFILKPFESNKFLDAVKNCLEGNKQQFAEGEEAKPSEIKINLENKYFQIEKKVFLKDTNLVGNTYFSNYILWQGETREACLMAHPNFAEEMTKNQHIHMITHSVYHRFIEETTFGDIIEIRLMTREIKRCSLVLVFQFYNKLRKSFVGEGWQRVAFVDKNTGSFCSIPLFIKELAVLIAEEEHSNDISKYRGN